MLFSRLNERRPGSRSVEIVSCTLVDNEKLVKRFVSSAEQGCESLNTAKLLFHATGEGGYQGICKDNFWKVNEDPNVSYTGATDPGWYGRGAYFATWEHIYTHWLSEQNNCTIAIISCT